MSSGLCIGCGSCVANSPEARMIMDQYGQLKPSGPGRWFAQPTAAFSRTCPFSPQARNEDELAARVFPFAAHQDAICGRWEGAYVGHAEAEDFRSRGSSGGLVTWVGVELLRRGMVDAVAHVESVDPKEGERRLFSYRLARDEDALRAGAKSRYYPIELSGVIEAIRATPGRYAVVGIPCFIKAIQLLRAEDVQLRERIVFTLGLVCGHMKSARLAESFAWQMDANIHEVAKIDYRRKNPERPANWYTAELTLTDGRIRTMDWWHMADGDWGAGFFQNSACNFCDDVVAETADISFGDAWVEPYSSDGRGTNVMIVRSPILHDLVRAGIAEGRLSLEAVDSAFIERTQAAGFRQRREGLAFRLSWPHRGIRPRKRVLPRWRGITVRRKLIYFMRYQISAWSHRVFWLARLLNRPNWYLRWARAALALYHAFAYSRGRLGGVIDRLGASDL